MRSNLARVCPLGGKIPCLAVESNKILLLLMEEGGSDLMAFKSPLLVGTGPMASLPLGLELQLSLPSLKEMLESFRIPKTKDLLLYYY